MKTVPQFVKCGSIHLDPESVLFIGPEQSNTPGKCTVAVRAGGGAMMVPCDVSAAKVVEEVELWHVNRDKSEAEWHSQNRERRREQIETEAKATAAAIAKAREGA